MACAGHELVRRGMIRRVAPASVTDTVSAADWSACFGGGECGRYVDGIPPRLVVHTGEGGKALLCVDPFTGVP